MSVGIMFFFVLIVSLGILAIAILFFRQQRILAEKKAQYVSCLKERDFHQRRYKACQVDIDKLRANHNSLMRELNHLLTEMGEKRSELANVLEILKEESKSIDDQMNQDLSRIVQRRKTMLKDDWQALNGQKASYLEKVKKVISDRQSMSAYIAKKEEEFKKWKEFETVLQMLKKQYEQLKRNPIIPFGRKKS